MKICVEFVLSFNFETTRNATREIDSEKWQTDAQKHSVYYDGSVEEKNQQPNTTEATGSLEMGFILLDSLKHYEWWACMHDDKFIFMPALGQIKTEK